MADEKSLIPFKSVNLSLIQKRIDKALEATRNYYSTELTGEEFNAFVYALFGVFPPNIRYDVLFTSVRDLAGQCLTREIIKNTVWRLAGNIDRLRASEPVLPFIRQTRLEWCPVTIVYGKPGRTKDGKHGFYYDYRVMAGQAAGMKFTVFWSLKYARFIARSLGFCRTRKVHYKFMHGLDLVKMRLYLLFDPLLSRDDNPYAYHFFVPSSCKTANQDILKQRFRITPCPLEYTLTETPCHVCPQGYDDCRAGCHPLTFQEKGCPRCGNKKAWFDPLENSPICVDCIEQARRGNG